MENMVPYSELKEEADRIREDVYEDVYQELLDLFVPEDEARVKAEDEAEDAYQAYWEGQLE